MVVVVAPGRAAAGTIPPVSAVNEIATPEATTTAALRARQIPSGGFIADQFLSERAESVLHPLRVGVSRLRCHS